MVKKAVKEVARPFKSLFDTPELPEEDPSVSALRERQVRDLAKLDEEENRRIKQALFPRQRAFRRTSEGPSNSVRSTSGSTGQAALTRAINFNPR